MTVYVNALEACHLCGLNLGLAEAAEMYNPDSEAGSMLVHRKCGERHNLEFERWVCADCHEVTL